jgi:hypothetical protein
MIAASAVAYRQGKQHKPGRFGWVGSALFVDVKSLEICPGVDLLSIEGRFLLDP